MKIKEIKLSDIDLDNASLQEREILHTHNAEHKLIEIDLRKNKHQFKNIIQSFLI